MLNTDMYNIVFTTPSLKKDTCLSYIKWKIDARRCMIQVLKPTMTTTLTLHCWIKWIITILQVKGDMVSLFFSFSIKIPIFVLINSRVCLVHHNWICMWILMECPKLSSVVVLLSGMSHVCGFQILCVSIWWTSSKHSAKDMGEMKRGWWSVIFSRYIIFSQ